MILEIHLPGGAFARCECLGWRSADSQLAMFLTIRTAREAVIGDLHQFLDTSRTAAADIGAELKIVSPPPPVETQQAA